jgi:hypothetical protein
MLTWMGSYGVYGVHMDQDRDQCSALVNVVTNLGFRKMWEFVELKNKAYSFQDGICSMRL